MNNLPIDDSMTYRQTKNLLKKYVQACCCPTVMSANYDNCKILQIFDLQLSIMVI